MPKSSRSLWTKKIIEGDVKASPSGGGAWTFEVLKRKSGLTELERKKNARTEQNLRGRQMRGVVLGIDPSLRGTGLSALESMPDGSLRYVESLTVTNPPKLSMAQCLARILDETEKIIARTRPRVRCDGAERLRPEFQNGFDSGVFARRGDCGGVEGGSGGF